MRTAFNNLMGLILLAMLAIGGQASLCSVVSVFGVDAHHHDHAAESSGICVETTSDCHEEERAPCPDNCEIELADVLLPDLLEPPSCPVADHQEPEWNSRGEISVPRQASRRLSGEPPPRVPLSDCAFTGRFLV